MTKILAFIIELVGWFQIFAFPLIAGVLLGAITYSYQQDTFGLTLAIIIALCGFVCGILLANRIWKKKGTINFLSKISGTPELDKKDEVKDNKEQ